MKSVFIAVSAFALLVILLPVTLFAGEGYYMEETIHKPAFHGQPEVIETVKTWILGDDQMRKDTKSGTETILFSLKDGNMFVLDHNEKNYIRIPIEQFRSMATMGLSIFMTEDEAGKNSVPEVLFKKTGNTRKIKTWDCYEIEIKGKSVMGSKTTQWVAKNSDFDSKIYAKIFTFVFGDALPEEYKSIVDRIVEIDGYPVQTITTLKFGEQTITTTQTLQTLEKKKIDLSFFQIPEGYKLKQMIQAPLQ